MRNQIADRQIGGAILGIWLCALLVLASTLYRRAEIVAPSPPAADTGQILPVATTSPISAAIAASTPTVTSIPSQSATTPIAATSAPDRAASPPVRVDIATPVIVPTAGAAVASVPLPAFVDQVETAIGGLRSGSLTVVIAYVGGTRSIVRSRFILDGARQVRAVHLTTTYQAPTGERTDERIVIGTQTWERQANGWVAQPNQDGELAQLLAFLPHPGTGVELRASFSAERVVLYYYDPLADADIILVADRTSGRPYTMQQSGRQSRTISTVTYSDWNMPIEILPPTVQPPLP